MGGRGLAIAGALAAVALLAATQACSETPALSFDDQDGSTAGDGPSGIDSPASADGPAGTDGGTGGGDAADSSAAADGDAGLPDALGDAGTDALINPCDAGYLCPATSACVTDCKTCNGNPVQCVACNAQNQVVRTACEPSNQGGTCTTGFQRCTCNGGDPANCGGPRQVCLNSLCYACGEANTDGQNCKGPPANKQCDDNGSGNPADEFTCR